MKRTSGKRYVVTEYRNGRVFRTFGSFYVKADAERACPAGCVVVAR